MAAAVIVYGTADEVRQSIADRMSTADAPGIGQVWQVATSHDPLSTGHDDSSPRWALTVLTNAAGQARTVADGVSFAVSGQDVRLQIMDEHRYVVGAEQKSVHDCQVSYFVIYRGPATDPGAFVGHYLDHHVPTMARLPAIQAMSIFVPPEPGPDGDLLVCQVCFESLDKLNAALASPVRQDLRQGAQAFPPFEGPVLHQAMLRSET